jgi:hypothetical protein
MREAIGYVVRVYVIRDEPLTSRQVVDLSALNN